MEESQFSVKASLSGRVESALDSLGITMQSLQAVFMCCLVVVALCFMLKTVVGSDLSSKNEIAIGIVSIMCFIGCIIVLFWAKSIPKESARRLSTDDVNNARHDENHPTNLTKIKQSRY